MKDRRKNVFPLATHQAQTNLPSMAVSEPYDPDSTAPYLDELLDKWALTILEGKWSQPLLEGYQRRGLSNGCWEQIPQREKTVFILMRKRCGLTKGMTPSHSLDPKLVPNTEKCC